MNISIIIPTFNRNTILISCVNSILFSIERDPNIEIIIVNDSKSNIIDLHSESDNIIIVNNPKQGAASARNYGASLAHGELLLFLDDDILINKKCLKSIQNLHTKYDKMMSTPIWTYSSEMLEKLKSTSFGRFRINHDYESVKGRDEEQIANEKDIFEVICLASFCLSIKKKHFFQLGGMDENFPYAGCEDQEFSMRAKKFGFKLLLDENNSVFHHEMDRLDSDKWLNRQYTGVQGFVLLAEKYPERKESALWYENTPIDLSQSLQIKMKKILKFIFRQDLFLALLKFMTKIVEFINLPDSILFNLYKFQAGLFINKGFNKSYGKL